MPLDLTKVDFLSDNSNAYVTVDVAGKQKRFWPLAYTHFMSFQANFGKIAAAFRDITHDYNSESGMQQETKRDERAGSRVSTMLALPITPQLAELHRKFRYDAVANLVNALDERLFANIGVCILDSMREDFPAPERGHTEADGAQLVKALPIPTLLQCLGGVFKANLDSFGPFVDRARSKLEEVVGLTQPPEPPSPPSTSSDEPPSTSSDPASPNPES